VGSETPQTSPWALAAAQHHLLTRAQLLELGFSERAIQHRIARGRLHPVYRGVYAVGRPPVTREARWLAAVLRCGSDAVLSHTSAAVLWGIRSSESGVIEISVPLHVDRRVDGVVLHRRTTLSAGDLTRQDCIPVTTPICTIIDLATQSTAERVEADINEADRLGLVSPEALRAALKGMKGRYGVPVLRRILHRQTFRLTRSQLERWFLPIAKRAGLPVPLTRQIVNGFEVDFYWPDLGLVVETDGLRYHRTAAQQAKDRVRDQQHTAAGLTPLRFTHAQIRYESRYVEETLAAVARRLRFLRTS
jgi:very-short-patch-repair endonuclease